MIWVQLINGQMEGMMLFFIAAGLTLIFGVSRIVNFAHGSLYMLGAFFIFTLVLLFAQDTIDGFFTSVLRAGIGVAVVGLISAIWALRRVNSLDDLMQLIITIALVLIIRDVVRWIWAQTAFLFPCLTP